MIFKDGLQVWENEAPRLSRQRVHRGPRGGAHSLWCVTHIYPISFPPLNYGYADSKECSAAGSIQFNELIPEDVFVRCAETTYECNSTIHGGKWFKINSTNEPVPADCKKDLYNLQTAAAFSGPLAMPGLTELTSIAFRGGYVKDESTGEFTIEATRISTIDLPDLVNITKWGFVIDNTASISSLNVPKLKHVATILQLNFTGGPALNLSFPSLIDVGVGIQLHGEIDA